MIELILPDLRDLLRKFDPDQPRDENGRWGSGGGGGDDGGSGEDRSVSAIRDYVNARAFDGAGVNHYLNAGGGPDEVWEVIDAIDEAMEPISEPMTVHRLDIGSSFSDLKPGDEFKDYAFLSTTSKREAIAQIAKDVHIDLETDPYAVLEISLPKGAKVIDVNKKLGNAHKFAHQHEILLDRGQTYIVDSVDGKNIKVSLKQRKK